MCVLVLCLWACPAPIEPPSTPPTAPAPTAPAPTAPAPTAPAPESPFPGSLTAKSSKQPMINRERMAPLRVMHRQYDGRELFVDGASRGPLPASVMLVAGAHTFEILVGPGDRLAFTRDVTASLGFRVLDLGLDP